MSLDINTPRGQISLSQEQKMLKHVESCWGVKIIETNKKDSTKIDGLISQNNVLVAIFESKCRNLSYDELCNYGTWLVTYNKIKAGQQLSMELKVPYIGFLYLVKDDITLYWKITDNNGKFTFDFIKEKTETQATINGGIAIRLNAYLPVEFSKKVVPMKFKNH